MKTPGSFVFIGVNKRLNRSLSHQVINDEPQTKLSELILVDWDVIITLQMFKKKVISHLLCWLWNQWSIKFVYAVFYDRVNKLAAYKLSCYCILHLDKNIHTKAVLSTRCPFHNLQTVRPTRYFTLFVKGGGPQKHTPTMLTDFCGPLN